MNYLIDKFLKTTTINTTGSWKNSKFFDWQQAGNKAKGTTGENFIKHLLDTQGYSDVVSVGGSADHDLKFDSQNIEVKLSFANRDESGEIVHDKFTWNHIGFLKNWEHIVFIGLNPPLSEGRVRGNWRDNSEELNVMWFTREQLEKLCDEGLIARQQGGKKGNNDDWMAGGTFFKKINYGAEYENIPF